MNSKYDEIMNLPHHVSKTRPQMLISRYVTSNEQNTYISWHKA